MTGARKFSVCIDSGISKKLDSSNYVFAAKTVIKSLGMEATDNIGDVRERRQQ